MICIIESLLVIQIVILLLFVIQSIKQRALFTYSHSIHCDVRDFDVIIAAREDIDVMRKCIDNIYNIGFDKIILCIDGKENVAAILKKQYPFLIIISNHAPLGKIKSQIRCLKNSSKCNVLIMDADITLVADEIKPFISYFNSSSVDFLCPYSIGKLSNNNRLLFSIEESDRFMRQRIVRAGRDAYGISNLSGYCMLANKEKYIDIIDSDAIQDDVAATINLFKKGYTVKTYHRVVCQELERGTFSSLLMQKTRWTAGNLILIKSYVQLFKTVGLNKAIAFVSSSFLWYWSLWIDCISLCVAIFIPNVWLFLLTEFIIKFIGLTIVSLPQNRILSNIMYIIIWPFFSMVCLLLSPLYLFGLIDEQKTRR